MSAYAESYRIAAVSMSFELYPTGSSKLRSQPCAEFDELASRVRTLWRKRVLPVAASGNDGATNAPTIPACIPGVVSVGAVWDALIAPPPERSRTDPTAADEVWCKSNAAPFLALLAPGAKIVRDALPAACGQAEGTGTSAAVPHVAGAIATLRGEGASQTKRWGAAPWRGSCERVDP